MWLQRKSCWFMPHINFQLNLKLPAINKHILLHYIHTCITYLLKAFFSNFFHFIFLTWEALSEGLAVSYLVCWGGVVTYHNENQLTTLKKRVWGLLMSLTSVVQYRYMYSIGLEFYTFWNFIRNQTENERDWRKNNFLQNIWKFTVFSHLHLKFAKIAIITQNMGIKKTPNFMLISNSLMPAFKNSP